MRIFAHKLDITMSEVSLLLELSDAKELYAYLGGIIEAMEAGEENIHVHVNDKSYAHEIMIATYSQGKKSSYSERIQKVIIEDN